MAELALVAARAVAVYVFMLVVIRLLGKRTVGNFSAFDLLVALMLGEVADEIIYGDVGMGKGAVAVLTIALAHYANSWLSFSGHGMDRLLEGAPTVLVRDGVFEKGAMRREHMNENDVRAELRLRGVSDPEEVELATLESDGEVSVIRRQSARPATKADLQRR